MDAQLVEKLLESLETVAAHAEKVDTDVQIRQSLAVLQAEDKIPEDQRLLDPPLVRLEMEAPHTLMSILLHICIGDEAEIKSHCRIEPRLIMLCQTILERFNVESDDPSEQPNERSGPGGRVVALTSDGKPVVMASTAAEFSMYTSLIVATLKALIVLQDPIFRRHLKPIFPLLTNMIACEYIPLEVQLALSEVLAERVGPLIANTAR